MVIANRHIENATFIENPEELELELAASPEIDALLFAFWSWKVPNSMLAEYKCFGMHTGFLLYNKGKGGTPIDNLKKLGIEWAALNVFEMNEIFDSGHVRLAIPIKLDRSKEDIVKFIDMCIPEIYCFLQQDISQVPERFQRLKNAG